MRYSRKCPFYVNIHFLNHFYKLISSTFNFILVLSCFPSGDVAVISITVPSASMYKSVIGFSGQKSVNRMVYGYSNRL